MTRLQAWGVYRELAHSPGRETDDAEILRATAAELSSRGYEVALKSPDELPDAVDFLGDGHRDGDVPPFFFVMCERPDVVAKLAIWEQRGARIVNRPAGIRNTDRERTIALFAEHAVPFPRSVLVPTAQPGAVFPGPCWVKRGDVHSTGAGDVAHAADAGELAAHLTRLASRGIARAVVQDHVRGDLVKFYGVAGLAEGAEPPSWFEWFYHRDQELGHYAFDARRLADAAGRAAASLSLEVYGGDAIVSEDGAIAIIDVNAWPSFALFRGVASRKIAAFLAARFVRAALPAPIGTAS